MGLLTILSAFIAFLKVDDMELNELLQGVALLNITIAIGLAAVSISLDKERKTLLLLNDIILIMLISVLSYFLSMWGEVTLMRGYFFISSLMIITIILRVFRHIFQYIESNYFENRKKNKGH